MWRGRRSLWGGRGRVWAGGRVAHRSRGRGSGASTPARSSACPQAAPPPFRRWPAAGAGPTTATSEGHSGTTAVTVSAVASGGTVLLQENFADASFAARGWYDAPDMPVTPAEHSAGSTAALEIHFAPGAVQAPWG